MPAKLDMVIIGSGPGGLAAGLLAKKYSNLIYTAVLDAKKVMDKILPD